MNSGPGTARPVAEPRARWLAWVGAALVLIAGAGAVAARRPAGARALHALRARWREMNTPGSGRAAVLPPDVLPMVAAMQKEGLRSFRFTPGLGNDIEIASFLVEASWPIECRVEDEHVVGRVEDLSGRAGCRVLEVRGALALADCRL